MKYNYIVNPKSGRKVSIYGKIGNKILFKYFKIIGGATAAATSSPPQTNLKCNNCSRSIIPAQTISNIDTHRVCTCHLTIYCSKNCQLNHWTSHKKSHDKIIRNRTILKQNPTILSNMALHALSKIPPGFSTNPTNPTNLRDNNPDWKLIRDNPLS